MKKALAVLALSLCVLPAMAATSMAHIQPGSCEKPAWPRESLRALEKGRVIVAFLVGADGKLNETTVLRSSGFARLDRASVEGLALCQFKPAIEDGKPIAAWARIAYAWTFENQGLSSSELSAMERSARQGAAASQFELGKIYLSGRAGKRNVEAGTQWIRRAADQGLAGAQVAMALTKISSRRFNNTSEETVDWLRKAAAQDHPAGLYLLARVMMAQGKTAEAQPLMDRAVAQQHPEAMSLAGVQLLDNGRSEDLPRATALLQQAAAKGDNNAHWMLAESYAIGRGLPQSNELAVEHLRPAAIAGIGPAQRELGLAYATGKGIKQDAALARLWRDAADETDKRKARADAEAQANPDK